MSFTCSTGSTAVTGSAPGPSGPCYVQLLGNHFAGALSDEVHCNTLWGVTYTSENEQADEIQSGASGNWNSVVALYLANKTYKFQAKARDPGYGGSVYGVVRSRQTQAMIATASTPTSSNVLAITADIACNYVPNVLESAASAQLQYKKTTDGTWLNGGTAGVLGGYVTRSVTASLTGLDPSTQYQVRLVITRTTGNDTVCTSATASFTTIGDPPEITTDEASGVSHTSANLNGSIVINDGLTVVVHFVWDTSNPPTANVTADQSVSADGSFQQPISGLSAATPYYYKTVVTYTGPTGSPIEGDVVDFTTAQAPAVAAAEEDHVMFIEMQGRYGVAKTIAFCLVQPAASSSDLLYTGTAPVKADCLISIDGAAPAAATNNPAQVGSTQWYTLALTAAELTALEYVDLVIHDASATTFRDLWIRIWTRLEYSQLLLDAATGSLTNTSGLKVVGYGSGHGIEAIGGATGMDISGIFGKHVLRSGLIATGGANPVLDTGASATNDFYNDALIFIFSGTGAGQARVVADYVGGTKAVTPNRAWSTNPGTGAGYMLLPGPDTWNVSPGAELAAIPTFASGFGSLLQLVFQRFAYKITQTATVQTFYEADAGTALAARSVGDDGVTQTIGMLT